MRYISVIPKSFQGLASGRSLHIVLYNRIGCFRPDWIKRKWPWPFCNCRGRFDYKRRFYCWSSFAGNVFLVTGRFDCFDRFCGAVNSRISTTRAENVTQYLLITRRVWAIVNEDRTKRSFRFMKISWHESRAIFVKHSFRNDTDLFSIARTFKKSHVLSIPADVRVKFSLKKSLKTQKDLIGWNRQN